MIKKMLSVCVCLMALSVCFAGCNNNQILDMVDGDKLRYGYVYMLEGTTDIAVNINEKYFIAELTDK